MEAEPIGGQNLSPAGRIAAIYIILGVMWIPGSDSLIPVITTDLSVATKIAIYKGWSFILLSGWLIYHLLSRELSRTKKAETARRDSEERLRLFIEHAPAALAMLDHEMRYLAVSRRWIHDYRLEDKDIIGRSHYEIFSEIPDRWKEAHRRGLNGEVVQANEDHFERIDAPDQWLRREVRPWYNSSGTIGGTIIFTEDITERQLAGEALRESEDRYRAIADLSPAGVFVAVDGCFVYANGAFVKILALVDSADIIGKSAFEFLHPDYHEVVKEHIGTMLETGRPVPVFEEKVLRSDGAVVDVEVTAAPIDYGGRRGILVVVSEITGRKKAEEAVAESELLYRTLFEGDRDAIMMMDMEGDSVGRIVSANPVAAEIHGYSLDEFTTLRLQDLEPPECAEGLSARFKTVLSGQMIRGEVSRRRKDGSLLPLDVSVNLVEIRGHKYSIGIDRDISERKLAEELIAAERAKFKSILDHMPDSVYIANAQHEIEYVNPALVSERGEVAGRKCHEYLMGRTEPCPWCRHREVLEGESILWERTSDVTGKTYDIFETPINNQDGSISILVILHDVTDRKNSEKLLREGEQRYRTLLSAAGNGIVVQEKDGIITTWNAEAERIFGIGSEEILGKSVLDIEWQVYREDGCHLPASEHPCNQTLAFGMPVRNVIIKIVRPSGDYSWVTVNAAPIFDGENSAPAAVIIALTDITDRKEMERTLHESEQFLRQTERIACVGGWRANPFTDELHWTQGVHEIIEAPMEYKPGLEEGLKFYKPQYIPLLKQMLIDTLESGLSHAMEVEVVTTGGKNLWAEVRSLTRVDEAGGPLVLGTFQDITERKSLERQLSQSQKMEAIGTLAGGVAHDFNNILQVVLGYSEILLGDEELPQRYQADLQKINVTGKRGADLVQRLLTFSRKTEINPEPLDLNLRITELRKMLERTLPKMVDIQLVQDIKLARISADKSQIDQVLMNLAVNARDAMPDGGKLLFETANVTLEEHYAGTHLDTKSGPYVLLTVTDAGSGMDQDTLEHIFEPFYTTKGVGEGTGLGLAMVHGIVKHHGGHINCYSELGKGTKFKIYFPALVSDDEEMEAPERPLPRGGSETILLVDDEEFVRDLGSRILTKAGYKVITASNGKEALEIFQDRAFEIALIVLDLIMPEMGGKQCLTEILKVDPGTKVVIASGLSANGHTKDALEGGVKGFVNKPYNLREMMEVVRAALDQD